MSEIDILYSHIINPSRDLIPKRIGAYVITHTIDNIYAEKYVGSTKNLYKRFYSHLNKDIIYVDLYVTDDIKVAQSLERILMELISPVTNINIPSLSDKDKDLMKKLLEDTNIKEYILNNITKIGYRYLKYINKHNEHKVRIVSVVRTILNLNGSSAITIPKSFGFKKGDHVMVEKINDNSCKITKIIWNKVQ